MRSFRVSGGDRERGGFTLIELAVAMMLIAVGLIGAAALMSTSLRYQRGAATREDMITIAETKLDELRSYQIAPTGSPSWNMLAAGGSVTSSVTGYADSLTTLGGKSYRRRWQLVDAIAGTRELHLRVEPRFEDVYAARPLEFRTLVSPQR
jgi:prepilin-type N-terminal cleavage/methylation domain-containing protein